MTRAEPYLQPKELAAALEGHGLHFDLLRARELVKAMRATGGPVFMRRHVRASDAVAWLDANPRWTPYGKATPEHSRGIPSIPQP